MVKTRPLTVREFVFVVAGEFFYFDVAPDVHEVAVVFDIGPDKVDTLPNQGHDDVEPFGAEVFEFEELFEEVDLMLSVVGLEIVADG